MSAATDRYLKNTDALPVMPEVATKLLRTLSNEDTTIPEVAALIERDVGLAARVLRVANSAAFSSSRQVSSIKDAANLIGMRRLREMSMAACVANLFPANVKFDRERFWRHSLATAGNAKILATLCGLDTESAYLAGLVLRIGRVLMLQIEPEMVARCDELNDMPDTLVMHEIEWLGCSHLEVSAALSQRWEFPASVVAALSTVRAPLAELPFSPLGAVLRLAATLSDAGEMQLPEADTAQKLHAELMERLDMSFDDLAGHLQPWDTLTAGVDQMLK